MKDLKRTEYHTNYYKRNKEQMKERQRLYRQNNEEKVKAIEKAFHLSHPEIKKEDTLRMRCKRVGITVEFYHTLPKKCSFPHCRAVEAGGASDWNLDHDHKTGKFRGLLCRRHNMGLGLFKDSTEELQDAIDYLKQSE